MPARHAVLLIPPVCLRPSQLPCYKQHEQTNFHSPYTLPSSVSCKSCVCHSYANTRGVGVFFPFWNLPVGCSRFDSGSRRLSRSSTDYCQLITDLSTDLPRPCRGHCHPCLKSFSCNTYKKPGGVHLPLDVPIFRRSDAQSASQVGLRDADVPTLRHVFESPACPVPCQGHCHPSRRQCYHSEET